MNLRLNSNTPFPLYKKPSQTAMEDTLPTQACPSSSSSSIIMLCIFRIYSLLYHSLVLHFFFCNLLPFVESVSYKHLENCSIYKFRQVSNCMSFISGMTPRVSGPGRLPPGQPEAYELMPFRIARKACS